MQANLLRAYGQYSEELLEGCAKQAEYRVIVFALSYFHAALLERKKFGVGNLPASSSGRPSPVPLQGPVLRGSKHVQMLHAVCCRPRECLAVGAMGASPKMFRR